MCVYASLLNVSTLPGQSVEAKAEMSDDEGYKRAMPWAVT